MQVEDFQETILVNTRQSAINAGLLVKQGVYKGKQICFSKNLMSKIKKEDVQKIKEKGLALVEKEDPDDNNGYKFREIQEDIFLIFTPWEGLTFMTARDI